jgi:threonine/homoserine/homoserine lactone efflux protein
MFHGIQVAGDLPLFLQFLLAAGVALAAAAPIGAISILTIQRALSLGFWRAFRPTLGAVAGNGIYGVIAALGSGYLSTSIIGSKVWLRLIGSTILVVIGARLLTDRRKDRQDPGGSFGQLQLGLLKFILVLSNPLTLGFYIAAFAGLGLGSPGIFARQSLVLGGGIIFGALIWFTFICVAAGNFHLKLSDVLLDRFRRVIGALLVILGILSAVSAILK